MNDAWNLDGPKSPRFIDRATSCRSSAHFGIDLTWSDDGPVVQPRYLSQSAGGTEPPFALPTLPGTTLDRMCAILRCLWRGRQVCGCWALYLNIRRRRWIPMLPPQWCDDDGARVSLIYPPGGDPGSKLRLAGTCRTAAFASTNADLLEADLPPFDGLHLLWHPGRWLDASAFLTSAGASTAVPLDRVLMDQPDCNDWANCNRLYSLRQS